MKVFLLVMAVLLDTCLARSLMSAVEAQGHRIVTISTLCLLDDDLPVFKLVLAGHFTLYEEPAGGYTIS